MDLNEIPNDHMVIEPIFEVETIINVNEVEKRCSDVEDKCLTLQIHNKEVELEEIRGKIRVLEGEKAKIEEEVKGSKEKRLNLEGTETREAVVGELSLDGWSEEESKIDELMIENKVLECEKSFALREVEKWKRKCGEFELRVRELEERLSSEGKGDNHDMCSGVKKDGKSIGVGPSSKFGAIDGETEIEGTPCTGKQVKRRLDFCCDRSCSQEMSPSTPIGASVAFIDIDSDHDPDVPVENGLCLQSEVSASVVPDVTMDVEDEIGEGNDTLAKTPKRKRDLTVVTSDDELEEDEDMPKRRAFKIGNSQNEAEDDDSEDALPIKRIFKRVENSCQSDDEDNIPISQLKMKRGHGTRRSVRLQKKKNSGRVADDHDSRNRPRRRLVKHGHKIEVSSDDLTKKNVEDEESEDDDSDSKDSLSNFIVSDTDVEELEDDLSADANHHSQEDEEASNGGFRNILSQIQRCRDPNSKWLFEADMLSAFGKDPELCMRAVCALYRRQIAKEKLWMDGFHRLGIGFNKYDESRGAALGDFLTDGNPDNDVMKTVEELEAYDPKGPEDCQRLASHYSTQLFKMYQTEEDEFFP